MRKTITKIAVALSLATTFNAAAQNTVTFDTFTLAADTFYQDAAGTDFSSGGVTFRYDYSFGYWSGGTAYTNKKDTVFTAQTTPPYYANLYSCITGTALSGSNYATMQSGAVVTFSNANTGLAGFYINNTTFAWKAIKSGNMFSRKFGDTTGTGSGTSIPQGEYPDWFKVIVRGYRSGAMITDSVEYYLADYRPAGTSNDYVIKNWQFVNCSSLRQVDSVMFELKSSDTGMFGMNTPAYFSIDDFTTNFSIGVNELASVSNVSLFPNPSNSDVSVKYTSKTETELSVNVYDIAGKNVIATTSRNQAGENTIHIESASLEAGVYFIELKDAVSSKKIKFIKL
jgi:hypothetical protein